MKPSFYFVLWIVIYPILGLFYNNFIGNKAVGFDRNEIHSMYPQITQTIRTIP